MRKKTRLNIVERAIIAVPGFEEVAKKLEQQVVLRRQSMSALKNYISRIALVSLNFGWLPHEINEDEINEYLVGLARNSYVYIGSERAGRKAGTGYQRSLLPYLQKRKDGSHQRASSHMIPRRTPTHTFTFSTKLSRRPELIQFLEQVFLCPNRTKTGAKPSLKYFSWYI